MPSRAICRLQGKSFDDGAETRVECNGWSVQHYDNNNDGDDDVDGDGDDDDDVDDYSGKDKILPKA